MEEELQATEIPTVPPADAIEYVEDENTELTVLKPVTYDVGDLSATKSEIFNKMDIDNHNVDFDETDNKDTECASNSLNKCPDEESINESGDAPESAVKLNGVLHSYPDKTPDLSPIQGKSRYGRIRKPKLSTDFVSVDKKSFAVLNNSSSYEPASADDAPGKSQVKRKKRSYNRRSILPVTEPKPETDKSITKEPIEKVSYITQSLSANDDKVEEPANDISHSPAPKAELKDDLFEPSISPLNCKDTLKTYSRKGETSISSSTSLDHDQTPTIDDQVKTPQISHVELNWKVGDVAWAKIGCYPYWPSIVTLEYGSSIYVKSVGHRRLGVHVQFFGDRGRRSWVLTTSLIKFQSKEQFLELKQQYKKDKIRFKYFLIKSSCQDLWEKAITEADTVLKLPHDERIPYYQSLYPVAEETYVAEMNMLKAKQIPVRRKKNPEERRGRKRKILDVSLNDSTNQETKKPRQPATENVSTDTEKLPSSSETPVKKPRQLDEHTKKRRAFMRRMNKILKQSNNNDYPIKKGVQNGLKLQRMRNAKFNKLLNKENEKNKKNNQPGTSTSPATDQKKKDLSVYDFESDEETGIFIGMYNSRCPPQVLADTEAEKSDKDTDNEKKSDDGKPSTSVGENNQLSSNESKARRLFADDKKPKASTSQRVQTKAVGSKFSKLFEHRKTSKKSQKNVRTLRSQITQAKQTKSIKARKLRERNQAQPEIKDEKKSEVKPEKEIEIRKNPIEKLKTNENPTFEIFKEKMTDKVNTEHPEFSDDEVEKQLEKLWNELDDIEKSKYKPEEPESTSDDGEDEVKSSSNENDDDSKSDEKHSSSPSPALRPRKISNIFTGYKLEKVCQICEKTGDTVRCRGPCAGYYHVECVQKMAAKGDDDPINKSPPKRGRRKKSSIKLEPKAENTPGAIKDEKIEVAEENETDLPTAEAIETDTEETKKGERKSPDSNECETIAQIQHKSKPTLRRSRRFIEEAERQQIARKESEEEKEDQQEASNDEKMQVDDIPEEADKIDSVEMMVDVQVVDAIKNKAELFDESNSEAGPSSTKVISESKSETDDQTESKSKEADPSLPKITSESKSENDDQTESKSEEAGPSSPKVTSESKSESDDQTESKSEETGPSSPKVTSESKSENDDQAESKSEKAGPTSPKVASPNKPENDDDQVKSIIEDQDRSDEPSKTEKDETKEPKDDKEDVNDGATKTDNVNSDILDKDDAAASDSSENLSISTKTDNSNGIDFRCHQCSEGRTHPCFCCGRKVEEKTGETEKYSCYVANCGRSFHKECLKAWPQATWNVNNGKPRNSISNGSTSKETLMCPQHYCHTCISDNPPVLKNKLSQGKLVRCIRCPTSYHQSVHCIPAGSELLTMTQIICPRHYEPPKTKSTHVNTSWCFICCIGGSLICCEECPTSFHAECLKLSPEEYEGRYICDDCQTGRYLLYGEVIWVKLGHYRWWPAHVLYPHEIPDNIAHLPHRRGEFVVRFFGSHDYNWVNRGRAFLYQEGDSGRKYCGRSTVDLTFEKALIEAEEAHQKLKIDKALRDEEAKVGLKPPRYVRIKSNKPVGNVRVVELNTSNIPDCKCDPNSERPCAPESDCLNRMLMVECNPRVCSAGERCLNQAFETRVYPPMVPYKTDKRGWGLKTLVDLKKGDFIIEYVGEMIDEEEYKIRVSHMYKNQEDNYYFLNIDSNRMLDAGPKGNVSRFMNHSCDPNCETQKWTVNGDTRVGLFAAKDIPANTELVFNYNLSTQGNEMKPCLCGSEKCSGFIGVKAVKNGNNGNGEEDGRKRSNEENRKRSLDDKSTPGQKGKKIKKKLTKAKRKALASKNAKKKKTTPKPKDESSENAINEDNDVDNTTETSDETEKEEKDTTEKNPKTSKDQKPKNTGANKKEKSKNTKNLEKKEKSQEQTDESEKSTEELDTDEQNLDEVKTEKEESENDETQPEDKQPTDTETEDTLVVLEGNSKEKVRKELQTRRHEALSDKKKPKYTVKKNSSGKATTVGQKKTLRKRKEKLSAQKRGKKILPKKKKLMKSVVKGKKCEDNTLKKRGRKPNLTDNTLKKRGRKPHLTEEDKEVALYKTLKKRIQRKVRFMTGISKLDEICYMCGKAGELIVCDNKKCPRSYHITCVKKFKLPKGRWLCPWHYCTECNSKCKVIKCSKCINSFCRLHIENNVFIDPDENFICRDHKAEYLAAKLLTVARAEGELANMSTDNESLNATTSSIEPSEAESLLTPLKVFKSIVKRTKPVPRTSFIPSMQIKEEALSDTDNEIQPKPVVITESRNVARRSKKLGPKFKHIDNMEIDDFIEVHHVDTIEVSASEVNEAESPLSADNDEVKNEECVNNAETSDDDYVGLEMEVIDDDSS